jgi:hypothetical protein
MASVPIDVAVDDEMLVLFLFDDEISLQTLFINDEI